MLNQAQATAFEQRVNDARTRQRQDKQHPLLINTKDGRLMPNVPRIRKKADYAVYTGHPKATLEDRMRYLQSLGGTGGARRRVVNSADDEPFDIGKATKQELVDFATSEYQANLDVKVDHRILRKQVQALAERFQAMIDKSVAAAAITTSGTDDDMSS